MTSKEEIKEILEEYAGQMVCRGLDTLYNDDEAIDEIVDMIMKVVKK